MIRRREYETYITVLFRKNKFLNEKWLNMNKEIAYIKILRWANKNSIRNLDRYLDEVMYK
jgi:hypothetical protein